jgi:hypothetical protein
MNCCGKDHLDCRHLCEREDFWYCDLRKGVVTTPEKDGCLYYETPGEYAISEALGNIHMKLDKANEEWDTKVSRAIREAIVVFVIGIAIITLIIWWSP